MAHTAKAYKRSNKTPVSSGGDYGNSTRRTIASATSDSLGKVGAGKTKPGNPGSKMGVKKGKGQAPTDQASPGGVAAGHSRTNRGKNSTTAGAQGMRG